MARLKKLSKVCESPILIYPDFNKTFYVTTDASKYAIGAILPQRLSVGEDRPIAYASRSAREEFELTRENIAIFFFNNSR